MEMKGPAEQEPSGTGSTASRPASSLFASLPVETRRRQHHGALGGLAPFVSVVTARTWDGVRRTYLGAQSLRSC